VNGVWEGKAKFWGTSVVIKNIGKGILYLPRRDEEVGIFRASFGLFSCDLMLLT
jgi:hypothetical protein